MEEKYRFLPSQIIIRTLVFLVLLNLLFLDIVIFRNQKTEVIEKIIPASIVSNICPADCLSEIRSIVKQATSSVKLSEITPAPTNKPTPLAKPASQALNTSLAKEFFVPFGIGSNSSDDWADVAGLKATLDPANYGNIKTVTFEASVRIPTGNQTAYVRLYNVTDKHPVWFSDVSLEGGTAQLLTSKPITLDSGNKTYQIQMKTSLKYPAFLDQSRLHIITN